jgi:hypothetical protein
MFFSDADLITGHFSHDQLVLLRTLWDQPHIQRPLIVKPFIIGDNGKPTAVVDDSQRFYAVRGITDIWRHEIRGWLLISQAGEEKLLFLNGIDSLFANYFIVRD